MLVTRWRRRRCKHSKGTRSFNGNILIAVLLLVSNPSGSFVSSFGRERVTKWFNFSSSFLLGLARQNFSSLAAAASSSTDWQRSTGIQRIHVSNWECKANCVCAINFRVFCGFCAFLIAAPTLELLKKLFFQPFLNVAGGSFDCGGDKYSNSVWKCPRKFWVFFDCSKEQYSSS